MTMPVQDDSRWGRRHPVVSATRGAGVRDGGGAAPEDACAPSGWI